MFLMKELHESQFYCVILYFAYFNQQKNKYLDNSKTEFGTKLLFNNLSDCLHHAPVLYFVLYSNFAVISNVLSKIPKTAETVDIFFWGQ